MATGFLVLPFGKTGKRLPGLIKDMDLVVVEGGPHAIPWTHTDQVNAALLKFLGHPASAARGQTIVRPPSTVTICPVM